MGGDKHGAGILSKSAIHHVHNVSLPRIVEMRVAQLQPVFHYLNERSSAWLGALEEQLVAGLRALEVDHERVKSIAGWGYIINSISTAN
ncbi:transposase (fragment) [Acidithiobacillus ferrivorans]|uniref:Transposase n=1 Tax=Acidithiobacillus ferrivorans TaxID=160808 RepID=A0ABY1MNU4_9PROT